MPLPRFASGLPGLKPASLQYCIGGVEYLRKSGDGHSFPNYFSTIANVFDRYEYSGPLDRVTLISRANVEENLDGEIWREVSNSE